MARSPLVIGKGASTVCIFGGEASEGLNVIQGLDGTHRCLGKPYPSDVGMHRRRYLQNKKAVSLRLSLSPCL